TNRSQGQHPLLDGGGDLGVAAAEAVVGTVDPHGRGRAGHEGDRLLELGGRAERVLRPRHEQRRDLHLREMIDAAGPGPAGPALRYGKSMRTTTTGASECSMATSAGAVRS